MPLITAVLGTPAGDIPLFPLEQNPKETGEFEYDLVFSIIVPPGEAIEMIGMNWKFSGFKIAGMKYITLD